MRIGRIAGAALLLTSLAAAMPPAARAQDRPGPSGAQTRADNGRGRREEVLRRREALRQRQEELRRARQEARRGPMASESFTRVARIGRQGTLNLVNGSGTVTIAGGGGDDVRIEATKRVWNTTGASAKASLADVTIDVAERQGAVDVRTTYPRQRQLDVEVDFTITVPAGASVSVRNGSGDVTVTGVGGELRAEAVAGAIRATSVKQLRFLRTISGPVEVENADSSDVTISTLGGPVTIRQLRARSADVRTVGGDLQMIDSDAEQINAQSLTGRVEVTGRLARSGRYTLQSQSGNVTLTPIGGGGFELEATTVNGSVRSDFPLTLDERRDAGPRFGGRGGRIGSGRGARVGPVRVLRGLSGDGGPLVTLRSFSGEVAITRR